MYRSERHFGLDARPAQKLNLDVRDTQPGVRIAHAKAERERRRHLFADQKWANFVCWFAFLASIAVLGWLFFWR